MARLLLTWVMEARVETWWRDIRTGYRALLRQSGLTLAALLTLALGIGATGTVFSWIHGTILDPVPGASRTGDLVTVAKGPLKDNPSPPLSTPDLVDLRAQVRSLAGLMAYHDDWVSITGRGTPQRLFAAVVSADYFDVLGVRPVLGRTFRAGEDRADGQSPLVVISDTVWRTRFDGSPDVIGQSIEINTHVYTIIGVAPARFQGSKSGLRTDMWMPLNMDTALWHGDRLNRRGMEWLNAVGRLAPGVTRAQAEGELNTVMARVVAQFPSDHDGPQNIWIDPLWRSPFGANGYLARSLPALQVMTGLVLLLACANVANLLVLRAMGRRRELAIRMAAGAARWQLVRQLLIETLMLALAAGAAALAVTVWTSASFARLFPPSVHPLALNGRFDLTVIAVTFGIATLASVLAGTLPAWRASAVEPSLVMNEESGRGTAGPRRGRVSRVLVMVQVALSVLLLVSAGLCGRSLYRLRAVNPGFQVSGVLLSTIDLGDVGVDRQTRDRLYRDLREALVGHPQVRGAVLADWVPLTGRSPSEPVEFSDYGYARGEDHSVRRATVSAGYFTTMAIPLIAGREFTEADTSDAAPVMIINDAAARRYWPGRDAVGKGVRCRGRWFTVVGVSRTMKHFNVSESPEPLFFLCTGQTVPEQVTVHLRYDGDARAGFVLIAETVERLRAGTVVFDTMSMTDATALPTAIQQVAGTLAGGFGLVALVLAAVGLYGAVAFTTRSRTREMGVRLALGAHPARLFTMVMSDGLRLVGPGMTAGLVLAVAGGRLLQRALAGVDAADVVVYASVVAMLGCVTSMACAIPALRAASTEPVEALRHE